MGDTLFNIFGDHLSNPISRNVHKSVLCENANVGKLGLPSHTPRGKGAFPLTPSKKSNLQTPKASDLKKKTFLQNSGAFVQSLGPAPGDSKWGASKPASRSTVQMIYEDIPGVHTEDISSEDKIKIEYTRKPAYDYDDDLSDDELKMTDDQLHKLVHGLPECMSLPPMKKIEMQLDNSTEYPELDEFPAYDSDVSFDGPIIDDVDLPAVF